MYTKRVKNTLVFKMHLTKDLVICFQLIIIVNLPLSGCKYIEGEVNTLENWAFVARFCFLSEEGRFQYTIEYNKAFAVQNLLLYYDTDNQWPAVYKTNKSCREREAVMAAGQNQVVSLSPRSPFLSGCSEEEDGTFRCQNERRFRSARERWWFLAVSNCNASKGLSLRYKFLMTNGPPEDYWRHHFSADEFYILPLLMAFLFAYVVLLFTVLIFAVELRARQLLHTTYKQFAGSVGLQTAGIALQGIAYARFAADGVGLPAIKTLGRLLEATSETLFLLLLLLLAQGYTVTRGRLKLGAAVRLTAFMCLYCAAQLALFAWESQLFDPGEVLYLYESPVGHGLAGLRMVAWARALLSTAQTLARGPETKARFYKRFAVLAALWFISNPILVLAASLWVDKWVRETVVCGTSHVIALLGHLAFCMLTRPSRANANFPYHVRTSQVGVMAPSVSEDSECSFGEHAYAPSGLPVSVFSRPKNQRQSPNGDWASHVPVGLFTVSHSISQAETTPAAADAGNMDNMAAMRTGEAIRNSMTAIRSGDVIRNNMADMRSDVISRFNVGRAEEASRENMAFTNDDDVINNMASMRSDVIARFNVGRNDDVTRDNMASMRNNNDVINNMASVRNNDDVIRDNMASVRNDDDVTRDNMASMRIDDVTNANVESNETQENITRVKLESSAR